MARTQSVPRETKESLYKKIEELEGDLEDLQLLYDTTMEHGDALEEQLVIQNQKIETLRDKMRRVFHRDGTFNCSYSHCHSQSPARHTKEP